MSAYFNDEKMYTFIKGYAKGLEMHETQKALGFARKLHKEQHRKSGEPYITHPLTMACHALAMGIKNDALIATLLLHDVVEDCGVSVNDLPCNETVKNAVLLLTYVKPKKYLERDGEGISIVEVKKKYYEGISTNEIAIMAKLFDRCHNVSTMAGTFTKEKLLEYIDETEIFVLPLVRIVKDNFVDYSDAAFVLKYHIVSILQAIKGTIETFQEK